MASWSDLGTCPSTGWSFFRPLPTLLRCDEPVILDARHKSSELSSDLYLTAAQPIQSTWVPANRRRSSAPETPHSLHFSSLVFTARAVDIILDCTTTDCERWGFTLVDVCLAASALVPWPVLLLRFFLGASLHDRTSCKSFPSQTRWKSLPSSIFCKSCTSWNQARWRWVDLLILRSIFPCPWFLILRWILRKAVK